MERSGAAAVGAVHAADLLDLTRSPGPFLTLYVSSPPSRTAKDVETAVNSALEAAARSGIVCARRVLREHQRLNP